MGNRASITAHPITKDSVGIYLHWNGGQESVEGFCAAAKEIGIRDLVSDPQYGLARLAQVIGNFFGGTLSVGVGKVMEQDFSDNGIWSVDENWEIVKDNHKYAAKPRALCHHQRVIRDEICAEIVKRYQLIEALRE